MLWGSFSKIGVCPLIKIGNTLTDQKYNSIISETMIPFAEETMVSGYFSMTTTRNTSAEQYPGFTLAQPESRPKSN